MTFVEYTQLPQSEKILIVEVDAPLNDLVWINYVGGIWFTTTSPGSGDLTDDQGNTAYWQGRNDQYYNIQSLNAGGELYSEAASLAACIATEKTWYYDTSTTYLYAHFEDWNIPEYYTYVAPGAVIGFTNETGDSSYYEDIYYEPLVTSVPNISKKRDSLFFGVLQYQGGDITFSNANGYFDNFSSLDLYGQPVRIKLTFNGLAFSEAETRYTARVDDFSMAGFNSFKLRILDARKQLSRTLPINEFNSTDHPDMDDKFYGTPIPIPFGEIIKAPAYYIGSNTWQFADPSLNAIDSGITVYDKDDATFSHSGTGTNGTFTGTASGTADDDKLTVSFSQTTTANGLSVLEQLIEEYENITYNSFNYDQIEWTSEKAGAYDLSLWIGKGNLKKTIDVINEVCKANQGIFDVLANGKFTFRTFNEDKAPTHELYEDEYIVDPSVEWDSTEYLSSITIGYKKDYKAKEFQEYTNTDFEDEVYGRYRKHQKTPKPYNVALSSEADAIKLSNTIMNRSKFIYPKVKHVSKIQNIKARIMDNVVYEHKRQIGNVIIERSIYETQAINMNLSAYQVSLNLRQVKTTNKTYMTYNGGDSTTNYICMCGGDSTTDYDIIDGGGSV